MHAYPQDSWLQPIRVQSGALSVMRTDLRERKQKENKERKSERHQNSAHRHKEGRTGGREEETGEGEKERIREGEKEADSVVSEAILYEITHVFRKLE